MHHYAHHREDPVPENSVFVRFRTDLVIALTAAVPTSITAVALTGSILLGVLTAAFTIAAISLAALMI